VFGKKLEKFGRVVFEFCEWTDGQTDILIGTIEVNVYALVL